MYNKKSFLSVFITLFDNSCYNINVCILLSLPFVYLRKHSQSLYLIQHVSHFPHALSLFNFPLVMSDLMTADMMTDLFYPTGTLLLCYQSLILLKNLFTALT